MDKSTTDLKEALLKSPDLDQYFRSEEDNLVRKPLGTLLIDLASEKKISLTALLKDCGLSKPYFYALLNSEKKNPSREIIIAILISLGCTVDECDRILKYAGQAPLYPRDKWDAAIIYAREAGYDLLDTDDFLTEHNLQPFRHLHN